MIVYTVPLLLKVKVIEVMNFISTSDHARRLQPSALPIGLHAHKIGLLKTDFHRVHAQKFA